MTIRYDEADIPEGANPANLVIAYIDSETGESVFLPGVVDTNTATVTLWVDGISAYAILALVLAPIPTCTPAPTPTPTPTLTPTSTPTPDRAATLAPGLGPGAWSGIGLGILALIEFPLWGLVWLRRRGLRWSNQQLTPAPDLSTEEPPGEEDE